MKILVFVKQVPDTDDVKLDPKTGNLKREGVASMINPLDANALEAAVQLKEKYGATVVAISMGPPQAEDVLKKALALGCDEACLLSDRAFGGADTLATAYTLSKAAEKIGDYDLLLFGRHAVDGDTAQTAPPPRPASASRRSPSPPPLMCRTAGSSATGCWRTACRRCGQSSPLSSPSPPTSTSPATPRPSIS